MKIINYGQSFEIYPDELKTYDKLPAGTYTIRFNPMSGFSLQKADDFEQLEPKIYGDHEAKITKVLKAFDTMERSLGVIMSGDKGIGKSLFTQLISERVVKEKDMPVILVTRAFQGVADYIESIDQEVLVLFDEFEKVFDPRKDNIEPQENLLGLFDGSSQKKRIYMITVNDLNKVNEFMINRPGRFHYHFRFAYPSSEEITTYLQDKISPEYYGEIGDVVNFSRRIKLNYDCLRAIAFELTLGVPFKEAITDLNILNLSRQAYNIKMHFQNGEVVDCGTEHMDLFSQSESFYTYINDDMLTFSFDTKDLIVAGNDIIIPEGKGELDLDDDNKQYTSDKYVFKQVVISPRQQQRYTFGDF